MNDLLTLAKERLLGGRMSELVIVLLDSFEVPGDQSNDKDLEMGTQSPLRSGEIGLDKFFEKVEDLEKQYEKLDNQLKKLQDAHNEWKGVTRAADMKGIMQRMEKETDEVGITAHFIKSKIEELDRDNLTNRQKPGCGKGTGVDRSRTSTTFAFKKKFKDKMSEFQTLRGNIHREYRELIEKRVFTVTGAIADEETIDRMIETGDSDRIFHNAIAEQGQTQIKDTLAGIQERHDSVKDLEKKLFDLHQIFLDMAVLIDLQGDMLDNIEAQVSSSIDHVKSGSTVLHKAKKLQDNTRKWMFIAVILLLSIVVIIVLDVVKPWKSHRGA